MRVYVGNIRDGLSAADPAGAEVFAANAADFLARIDALEAELLETIGTIPEDRRTVVTAHDSFAYFARDFGFTFMSPVGMSTDAEASAADVARLITQIRDEGISAVFLENIADDRLVTQIAAETGAVVGGTLFSDALSRPDGPAPTWIDLMRHNAGVLAAALAD